MSSYSNTERLLASILSYLPGLKAKIKWLYQYVNYLANKKNYNYKSEYDLTSTSSKKGETFFGYYDKSPENSNGRYTIYQETTSQTNKKPSPNEYINIILKDNQENREYAIAKSNAYNWQQGTKLQWLTANKFIFNFFDQNSYKSKIFDAELQKEISVIDAPIYDCYKDKYALSLNFSRLASLRPDYGYRNIDSKINFDDNETDGIILIDLDMNTKELLIPIQRVIDISTKPSMQNAKHKFNHLMISPDGDRFMFMHRWFIPGGKKYDRLLVADADGVNIKILCDDEMVSHCCWYDNNNIVGFFRHYSNGNSFYRINVLNREINLLSKKLLSFGDGHPTFYKDIMVFDTYPDRSRLKQLFTYNLGNDSIQEIGSFVEPIKYFGENRCDLHPKWNYKGNKIFIDSVHTNKRKLYEINL